MDPASSSLPAMAQLARRLSAPRDLATTLDTIVHVARDSMPSIDHVGITLARPKGRLETKAATGPLVIDLDALQYELGEGPCLHALAAEPIVLVEHAARERRWPRYIPRAVELGVRAQLGLRLYVEADATLGGLNLYSTSSDTIDSETQQIAELFAASAAAALRHVLVAGSLSEGLQSRTVIGTAVGIVMARYRMDDQQAFAYLARVSQQSNTKLNDVARELVTTHNEQHRVASSSTPPLLRQIPRRAKAH